jgi:hypothetical protein
MFGITPAGGLEFVSQRILSVQPDSIDQFSRFGTLKQLGFAKRLATLQTDSGPTAYVALSEIGLVGFEIEEPWWWVPFEDWITERKEPKVINGDFIEVATTRTKVWAVERNLERTRNTLRSFSPSLSALGGDLTLPGEPWSMHIATGFPVDANDDGQIASSELRDLAFVGLAFKAAAPRLLVVDVTGQVPFVVTDMKLGGVATDLVRSIDVDPLALRAAVVAGGNVMLVDLSAPDAAPLDRDSDGRDDRVVWVQPMPGVEVARIDANRALLYLGFTNGLGPILGADPPQQDHYGSLEIWQLAEGLLVKSISGVSFAREALPSVNSFALTTEDADDVRIKTPDEFLADPLLDGIEEIGELRKAVPTAFKARVEVIRRGPQDQLISWAVAPADDATTTAGALTLPGTPNHVLEFVGYSANGRRGARTPNPALHYIVTATILNTKGQPITKVVDVRQKPEDVIRQEYRDYFTAFQPAGGSDGHVRVPSNWRFNTGNYTAKGKVPSLIVERHPNSMRDLLTALDLRLNADGGPLRNDIQEVQVGSSVQKDGTPVAENTVVVSAGPPAGPTCPPGIELPPAPSIPALPAGCATPSLDTDPKGDDVCLNWGLASDPNGPGLIDVCIGVIVAGPNKTADTRANNRHGVALETLLSSAYRNPQRNRAVGSKSKDSLHTLGLAFDLTPYAASVFGKDPIYLMCAIHQVAREFLGNHVTGLAESIVEEPNGRIVDCTDARADHVHVGRSK